MTKNSKLTLKNKNIIKENRDTITAMLSGTESMKRLNNLNWLRHEISYTEPTKLFYSTRKSAIAAQTATFSFTCTKNLGDAYDYIISNIEQQITDYEICKLHSMLCANTYLECEGGHFRNCSKILDITIDGERYHAPDEYEIPTRLAQILYKLYNSHKDVLTKAFDIHYELIALQPFEDFNKRTARLVMNWILIQNGYRPIVFNSTTDKTNYANAIKSYLSGDRKAYTAYMTTCLIRTQKQIINLLKSSKSL